MSEYTNLAEFSSEGFNIGKDKKVLTYMHGLSDFWVHMFEDASKINLLLEANAITSSDIYNKFLQLTSVISLEGITTLTNTQIKLVLISTDNAVQGEVETYSFPADTPVKSSRCIANRAFLPTVLLEHNADFYIDADLNQISFSRPLSSLGFPFRNTTTGGREYALWFIDARIDDEVIYNYYAKLIGIDPTTSSDNFKNFVYGLYYLYVNGPNLAHLRKGLNITLGIPLAREIETVLEIKKYLNTDQYLVITDLNSYLIPYGLTPTVSVDDVLAVGDEIAVWVEVKDYQHDGEWWINFMIPSHVLPDVPTDIVGRNRYATSGSYADYLMQNYLKKHTFLVNVKTVSFKNIQSFEQLAKIIADVKPAYATPIYVWTVPTADEILALNDDGFYKSAVYQRCESLSDGTYRHERDATNPLTRDCPHLTRMSVARDLDKLCGYSAETNGPVRTYSDGNLTGFIAPQRGYRALTTKEAAWMTTLRGDRGQDQYQGRRGMLDRYRSNVLVGDGVSVHPITKTNFPGYRMVHLYTTTLDDVKTKFAFAGSSIPDSYLFTLFRPGQSSDLINEHALNESVLFNYYDVMVRNLDFFFTRDSSVGPISPFLPKDGYKTFKPTVSDLMEEDFLAFTRIFENAIGVFWITKNFNCETPPYWARDPADSLNIRISGKITRGMAPLGSPFYQVRCAGANITYNPSNAINEEQINDNQDTTASIAVYYGDSLNPSFPVDRSGRDLVTYNPLG